MHKAELMHCFDDWVTDPRLRLDDAAPLRGRSRAHRRPLLRALRGVGELGQQRRARRSSSRTPRRWRSTTRWRRCGGRFCGRCSDCSTHGASRERIAFVGAIGGHFASTVSIERLRRLNPALSGRLRSISFLQPRRRHGGGTERVRADRSSPPIRAPRCCWPRSAWPGGCECIAARGVDRRRRPVARRSANSCKRAFDCPVTNSYGASEFLSLACECEHGHLHLNSDWAILEPVDAQGRAVPPGETGATTLLTNLANHVQPADPLRPRRSRHGAGTRLRLRLAPARDRRAGPQRRHACIWAATGAGTVQRAAAGAEHGARGRCRPVRLPARAGRALASCLLRTGLCGVGGRTRVAARAPGARRVSRIPGRRGRACPLPQRRTRPRRPQRQGAAGGRRTALLSGLRGRRSPA